jgi:hypothetical protein
MLKVDSSPIAAVSDDIPAALPSSSELPQVVEVGLLMPAHWATALIELSKMRQVSVAQILRASVAQTLREVGLPV